MRSSTHRSEATEVLSTRPRESTSEADPISSARLVDALLVGGFEVFRIDKHGTILERERRAVVIPHGTRMRREVVDDLRKMAGLTLHQLETLLAHGGGGPSK